jgi:hypothetical protein
MADASLVCSSLPLTKNELMSTTDIHGIAQFVLIARTLVDGYCLQPFGKDLVQGDPKFTAPRLGALLPWILAFGDGDNNLRFAFARLSDRYVRPAPKRHVFGAVTLDPSTEIPSFCAGALDIQLEPIVAVTIDVINDARPILRTPQRLDCQLVRGHSVWHLAFLACTV